MISEAIRILDEGDAKLQIEMLHEELEQMQEELKEKNDLIKAKDDTIKAKDTLINELQKQVAEFYNK